MNPQAHQEIYRVAFESASSELIEINQEFESLRARMEKVGRLVEALKPLVADEENEAGEGTTLEAEGTALEAGSEPAQSGTEGTNEMEPAQTGADPFQHRVNHVLGIGAGIRDVRSYTRQF
jgi:hypothetical protein